MVSRYPSPTRVTCDGDEPRRRRWRRPEARRSRMRPRKSSGRPSATVTDSTPPAWASVSLSRRIWKPASSMVRPSSFSGAAYKRSASNPRGASPSRGRDRATGRSSRATARRSPPAARPSRDARVPTRNPPPPASSFNDEMITGRLKRKAGSHPKTRLVRRQIPNMIATMGRLTRSASCSCSGYRLPVSQDNSDGHVEEHQRGERSTRARQDDRFGQEILSQPCPAGADRLADGQLALAHRAAHLHHAGDIQAHDQQHHAGERVARRPECARCSDATSAPERVVRRGDAGLELVGRRILLWPAAP